MQVTTPEVRRHELVIIGTGSGNSIPPGYEHVDIAMVEDGKFGGTCLNVGCIPTKMFVYPADLAWGTRRAADLGVSAHVDKVDWTAIRDRIFTRIDAIEAGGRAYRSGPETPNITVYAGRGRFVGDKTLEVKLHDGSTQTIVGEKFVLAAGSRVIIPDIPGLDSPAVAGKVHTSDTVMRIPALPQRMVILGSGYIAAEFAHVFSSFGTAVTQIARGDRLLSSQDISVSKAFTIDARHEYDVLLNTTVSRISPDGDGLRIDLAGPDGASSISTDLLLIAVGRRPNGDELNVTATGVQMDAAGRVIVDDHQLTTEPDVWALGDICSPMQLKHVANREAKVVFYNILHPDAPISIDHRFIPWAVFTEPQIAGVGLTQQDADAKGVRYVTAEQPYAGIAAGWAREDGVNFAKLLADPDTGLLLGAHIIGPEAATLIQPLIQAMSFGLPADKMARGQFWIHPALTELVENALLKLPLAGTAG
ncbi:mycothione reductase [Nakamurella sp. DB0629]|uniref:Mycothione reductase n=1 Tax=Nakamurella aerolata TaxID=1656892 RepID=A0A849A3H1_9ACTN|nr:mycothione reductase [Nakamurella aerolata]